MTEKLPKTWVTVPVLAAVALPTEVQAYIDPGTGSLILQGLIAAVAGVAVTAGIYWSRFKAFFRRRGKRPDKADEAQDPRNDGQAKSPGDRSGS